VSATARSPQPPPASRPATKPSWSNCWPPNATTGKNAARPAWSATPASRVKRLEDFDFTVNPNIPAALVQTLARRAWGAAGQPLCLIGDSGAGNLRPNGGAKSEKNTGATPATQLSDRPLSTAGEYAGDASDVGR
jgi:hypothetical protein